MATIAVMKHFDNADSADNGMKFQTNFYCIDGYGRFEGWCWTIIPDGTTLAQSRALIAADIRAECVQTFGVTVPANRVYILDFVTA